MAALPSPYYSTADSWFDTTSYYAYFPAPDYPQHDSARYEALTKREKARARAVRTWQVLADMARAQETRARREMRARVRFGRADRQRMLQAQRARRRR